MNLYKPNAFDALPEPILRPGYDRAELTAGILHIGVGNFTEAIKPGIYIV